MDPPDSGLMGSAGLADTRGATSGPDGADTEQRDTRQRFARRVGGRGSGHRP